MGTGRIPTRRQLEVWLRQHSGTEPVSLRQYLRATEAQIGWKLSFCQLFIHDHLGGDEGVLKTKLRSAAREVARHEGVVGDWWVRETGPAVEASLVLADESLARLILLKEKEMKVQEVFEALQGLNADEVDELAGLLFDNMIGQLQAISQAFEVDAQWDIEERGLDEMVQAIGSKEIFRLILRDACGLKGRSLVEGEDEEGCSWGEDWGFVF